MYFIIKKTYRLVFIFLFFFLIYLFVLFFLIFFLVIFISYFSILNINYISVGWETLNIKNDLFELPLNDFNNSLQNHLFIKKQVDFFNSSYWFSDHLNHINDKRFLNSKLWFSNYNNNKGSFIYYVLNNHGDYLVGNSTLNLKKDDLIRLGDSFVSINSAELKELVFNSEEYSKNHINNFTKFGNYCNYLEMRDMVNISNNKIKFYY